MASIRKEILTTAAPAYAWNAVRDIGKLHERLVPGFVVDTTLEPGARIVTFANGMVVKELIVDLDDAARRLVWSAKSDVLTHHNASIEIYPTGDGGSRLVWTADLLPDAARDTIAAMIEQGAAVMMVTLDRLANWRDEPFIASV